MRVRIGLTLCVLVAVTGGCALPDEIKRACEGDQHCQSGRQCVLGLCQDRIEPGPPLFARLATDFQSLEGSSDFPGGLESPRAQRFEGFVIKTPGRLSNRGWGDGTLDPVWYDDFLPGKVLRDGIDATSWGDLRQDIVARNEDGRALHIFYQPKEERWNEQAIGLRTGRLRPAIAHLGRNRMVAFQVDDATSELWISRCIDDRWSEWAPAVAGVLGGGLDAATLFDSGTATGVQLVSRDGEGRLVTTAFSVATSTVAPWMIIAAQPPRGSTGQATVVAYQSKAFDVLVSSASGGIWRWSPARADGTFVSIGNSSGQAADLDAVAWTFDGRWRVAILRRDASSGALGLAQMVAEQ